MADDSPTVEERTAPPSELDDDALFRRLKQNFRDDQSHSDEWRAQAKEDFDFFACDQWSDEEKAMLAAGMRPEIVFNRAITLISAVAGFEINGRHEIQYLPRGIEDTALNELLTGASKWMGDECDAEDEESEAFQNTLICGMSWTENKLDFELEQNGKYIEESINPLEMYWDGKASKKNLTDARRISRLRTMSLEDARSLFPDKDDDALDAKWAVGSDHPGKPQSLDRVRLREENSEGPSENDDVRIVQMQWWERETYWLVADPATNSKIELDDERYQLLQKRIKALGVGVQLKAVKLTRRKFKQAFLGNEVLEVGDGPIPDQFSFGCITGQLHRTKRTWFGLIRLMRDPQKWANKWLSQTMHIMNSNAKGGIMAETDAFEDQRQAEISYPKPEAITWMKRGALSGQNGQKWIKKPVAEFPAGFFQLLEFAISSIRDVTGINLELLGMRDVNQPGILEAQRKQAGMTVLATMFDSLRRFRKQVGRMRLYYIQNFLSDGRLIRIVGPDGAKAIPLLQDKTAGEYDVVVDDTPTSPNQKEANWAMIAPMLPMFKEQLATNPELLLAILEYSPIPAKLIDTLRQLIQQSGQNPEIAQQKDLMRAKEVADINAAQSVAELNNAKAGATQATAEYDLAMAANLLTKHQGDMIRAAQEWQKQQQEANHTAATAPLDAAHKVAQIGTEQAKADHIRAQTDKTAADTAATQAQTAGTQVDTAVKALHPIPEHQDAFPKPVPAKAG